jgi:hypothetical protein
MSNISGDMLSPNRTTVGGHLAPKGFAKHDEVPKLHPKPMFHILTPCFHLNQMRPFFAIPASNLEEWRPAVNESGISSFKAQLGAATDFCCGAKIRCRSSCMLFWNPGVQIRTVPQNGSRSPQNENRWQYTLKAWEHMYFHNSGASNVQCKK